MIKQIKIILSFLISRSYGRYLYVHTVFGHLFNKMSALPHIPKLREAMNYVKIWNAFQGKKTRCL